MEEIVNAINDYGFPVVMCVGRLFCILHLVVYWRKDRPGIRRNAHGFN